MIYKLIIWPIMLSALRDLLCSKQYLHNRPGPTYLWHPSSSSSLLLPAFLLLYLLKIFQWYFGLVTGRCFIFMDSFQGSFKDGFVEGRYDCHYFSEQLIVVVKRIGQSLAPSEKVASKLWIIAIIRVIVLVHFIFRYVEVYPFCSKLIC